MHVAYTSAVSLSKNIRTWRRAANLNQAQVGAALGVGQAAVSRWERGKTQPDATLLPRLAVAIGATLNQLFEGEGGLGTTPAGATPYKGVVIEEAAHRIQELEGRIKVYEAVIRRLAVLAKEAEFITGSGPESRPAPRAKRRRRQRN